ncbi:hypothetical protein Tco_0915208, partial [Tanacetum coccineum]
SGVGGVAAAAKRILGAYEQIKRTLVVRSGGDDDLLMMAAVELGWRWEWWRRRCVGRQPEEVEARGGEWIWGSGRSGEGSIFLYILGSPEFGRKSGRRWWRWPEQLAGKDGGDGGGR